MSMNILHIQSRQIETLQYILLCQLKNFLIEVKNYLKKRTIEKRSVARQQLRNYFQHLPVITRSELLNMVLCPYRSFGGMFYRFKTGEESFDNCLLYLEALLSPGMDCVYPICPNLPGERNFYKILECLLQNANKLKVLLVPCSIYIYELDPTKYNALLSKLLIKNGSWLTNLQLCSGCNDRLMHIIGEYCQCLQNLDIKDSPVSDEGIQVLTQIWECRTEGELANDKERVDESLTNSRATESNRKPCNEIQNCNHICRYLCYKTKLCHSLRRINLLYTQVTEKGIHTLLSTVSNLEDIGISMAKVFDDLFWSYEDNLETFQCPSWNLRSLYISYLLPRHLAILTKLTNKKLTKNLKIELLSNPIATNVNHDLQIYIQCHCSNLTSLDLFSFLWAPNVSFFLKYCPNLISLKLSVQRLTWSDDKKPVPSPTLKFARLSRKISCESAILFMESASALKEVYFSTVEENAKFFTTLCATCISKELKVFYLQNPNFVKSPRLVSELWQCHKHIELIGNVDFDITELQLGSTVDLKLMNIVFADS